MVERYFNALIFVDVFPGHGSASRTIAPAKNPFHDLMLIIQVQVIGVTRRVAIFLVVNNGQLGGGSPADRCLFPLTYVIIITGIPSQLKGKQQPILIIDKTAVNVIEAAVFVG